MKRTSTPRAVVFGGAGFVGSRIALALWAADWDVTVVDGFLPRTGGARNNLTPCLSGITLIESRIEDLSNLEKLIDGALVVDSMGWTHHRDAFEDPAYDLALNVASHLPLVLAIRKVRPSLVCFLGSRHQYGHVDGVKIDEYTPLSASDVHGIHKIAAEMHYGQTVNTPVVSLRFGNTFGPGQPMCGEDIGLIGGFIRELLEGNPIRLFSPMRRRNCLFADDLAQTVLKLAQMQHSEFSAYNVAGHDITVGNLALHLVEAVGHGVIVTEEMPLEVAAMEVGNAIFSGARLESLLEVPRTPLGISLKATVEDVRNRLIQGANTVR